MVLERAKNLADWSSQVELFAILVVFLLVAWWYFVRAKRVDTPTATIAHTPSPTDAQATPPAPRQQDEHEGLAFIDLETTGLDPSEDRIIEVAVLFYEEGSTKFKGYSSLANPGTAIPEHITELTGITTEMVSGKAPTGSAVAELLDAIGGRQIVAYNAKFDMSFLRREASRLGRTIPNKYHCLMEYTKERYPNLRRYRLQDVCEAFEVEAQTSMEKGLSPHRAMFDAERAVRLYIAMSSGVDPQGEQAAEYESYSRRLDHGNTAKYHGIRSSAKLLQQEAKDLEASDIERAIYSYQSALRLHMESAKVQIFIATRQDNTLSLLPESGDIECLNRLTLCLCKTGKVADAQAAMNAYFDVFPKDATLKAAEQVRKRVEKAASKVQTQS